MTPTQQRIYDFIYEYMGEHGMAPKLKEIAEAFGTRIPAVHRHILELERKGYVEWPKTGGGRRRERGILLLSGTCPCCGSELDE